MNNSRINKKQLFWIGAGVLMLVGVAHRLLQLWLLWPHLVVSIMLTTNNQVMALLPQEMVREHPWWGLWFLQQAPPLPNAIWTAVSALIHSPLNVAVALILLQALFSCLTALAMALLFLRVGLTWWLALLLSTVFLFGGDLLLLEYHTMGQFFYEPLTMLFAYCLAMARSVFFEAIVGNIRSIWDFALLR